MECPECRNNIDDKVFYCPICGKKIREKPVNLDVWHIAWLFVLSGFLPPFNLGLTQKYLKSPDSKAKQIGWLSLIVMILSLVIVTIWGINWAKEVNRQVNEQMEQILGL